MSELFEKSIRTLELPAVLELLDVAGVLTAARRVSDYDAERQGEATAIDRLFSALHVNRYL